LLKKFHVRPIIRESRINEKAKGNTRKNTQKNVAEETEISKVMLDLAISHQMGSRTTSSFRIKLAIAEKRECRMAGRRRLQEEVLHYYLLTDKYNTDLSISK
jgi:hypothetical protein